MTMEPYGRGHHRTENVLPRFINTVTGPECAEAHLAAVVTPVMLALLESF